MTAHTADQLFYPPIGTPLEMLPTPALIINLPALEYNLMTMSEYFQTRSAKLRPHFKTHKCPIIAQKQVELGAIGLTCAKLSEAEVLVDAGLTSVLIANQVVQPSKIERLASLAGRCELIVAVDNADNLEQIAIAAQNAGNTVNILVEVDVGMHRSGVRPGEPAFQLAAKASSLPGVHFSGLLGYEGFTMFEIDRHKRSDNASGAMRMLVDTAEIIQRAGIPVEIVSGGGTGTYDLTGCFLGVTELEAGSYVFMDSKYMRLDLPFKRVLTLLATVTSVHSPTRCIIDSGMKVLTTDNGLPELVAPAGLKLVSLHEEHGIVEVDPVIAQVEVGACVEIFPSHGCTTVNLHDRYYVVNDGLLVDIWEITGRGKSQ